MEEISTNYTTAHGLFYGVVFVAPEHTGPIFCLLSLWNFLYFQSSPHPATTGKDPARLAIMDPANLSTASHYVNNLLLSRGLLRNGTPIEFARPSKGEGGKEATMAEIINLVHDLVLRRDVRKKHFSFHPILC
jgi:hypothetical protein